MRTLKVIPEDPNIDYFLCDELTSEPLSTGPSSFWEAYCVGTISYQEWISRIAKRLEKELHENH